MDSENVLDVDSEGCGRPPTLLNTFLPIVTMATYPHPRSHHFPISVSSSHQFMYQNWACSNNHLFLKPDEGLHLTSFQLCLHYFTIPGGTKLSGHGSLNWSSVARVHVLIWSLYTLDNKFNDKMCRCLSFQFSLCLLPPVSSWLVSSSEAAEKQTTPLEIGTDSLVTTKVFMHTHCCKPQTSDTAPPPALTTLINHMLTLINEPPWPRREVPCPHPCFNDRNWPQTHFNKLPGLEEKCHTPHTWPQTHFNKPPGLEEKCHAPPL